MEIYITLDYELFFGTNSGSAENCILKPTEALLEILDPYGIKFSCFADAGYLLALEKQMGDYRELQEDYNKVTRQLKLLAANGHGIELHIHPHWEDSRFDGNKWVFDTSRYKLPDFEEGAVMDIVTRYNSLLKRVAGRAPKAYRAGGWSAQPFAPIGKALAANGVFIDSTSYPGGHYESQRQVFDFRDVPMYKSGFRFASDLTREDPSGQFVEIPISAHRVPPAFYWRLAATKIGKGGQHRPFGDGSAIPMSGEGKLKLLTSYSNSVVSIDGFKASFLAEAFRDYVKHTDGKGNFVIIGHPKAFTKYSLKKLASFVEKTHRQHQYKTFQE